ncbi:MAG: NHL repeat-containing protein [Egibacteraceae bacterium]
MAEPQAGEQPQPLRLRERAVTTLLTSVERRARRAALLIPILLTLVLAAASTLLAGCNAAPQALSAEAPALLQAAPAESGGLPGVNPSPATATQLTNPIGLAVDAAGNLYIADTFNHQVRRLDLRSGMITTVAGSGVQGPSGDGGLATAAQLDRPLGLAVATGGNLYIADSGNHRVRRVDRSGIITTVAGSGIVGFSGDGGPAAAAQLRGPLGLAVDTGDNLYIADSGNHRVRKVDFSGVITTVAGSDVVGFSGDGGPAAAAQFVGPVGLAVDGDGNLYIADTDPNLEDTRNTDANRVRRVDPSGIITTVAGIGPYGFSGDGGPATAARFDGPWGLAVDADGDLYIADLGNSRVRRVDLPIGVITTVAGRGDRDFSGDGGRATAASLRGPWAVAVDAGNLYIADTLNNRVRRVDPTGTITTVAGGG